MTLPQFDGATYRPDDHERLSSQYRRIWDLMLDEQWRSLQEIAVEVDASTASVSAQLRHMRKVRFGCNQVEKRHEGGGFYLYRLRPTETGIQLVERTATR